MEDLIRISKFLDGFRLQQVNILGSDDNDSRYNELYSLIKEGKVTTDAEAVKHFYGDKATGRDQNYRRFKSYFRDRLINTLFFIDLRQSNITDLETATMSIQKEWAAINILYAKGELRLPTILAEQLLPNAIKYELTEIVVYITDRLKNSYGGQIGDIKKYTYYKRLQKTHMDIWQAEIKAKDLYQEIRMQFIKSNAHKPEVAKIAKQGLKELETALQKHTTIRLVFYAYIAKVAQYTIINDYKTAAKLSDEAIEVLKKKPFEVPTLINSFLNQKLICHIRLKEFEKGRKLIDEILGVQVSGSLSWFKTLEHAVTLAFHTKNYDEAYVLYTQARQHEQFNKLEMRHLEIWILYKGYLYFLISIGAIKKATLKSEEFVDFRLSKFLNDVHLFERDLEGMKISVLIIEIALMLVEERYGKMIDTVDALNKYRQRHLSKTHALYRHNIMIKMIAQVSRSGFVKAKLKRVTEVPLRNMKKITIQSDGQSFQLEIIPLEDMWDFIVETLK